MSFGMFESPINRIEREAAARAGVAPPFGLGAGFHSGESVPLVTPEGEVAGGFQPGDGGAHEIVTKLTGADRFVQPPIAERISQAFSTLLGALAETVEQNSDLYGELLSFRTRFNQRMQEQQDARVTVLKAESERLYPLCRQALDELNLLNTELASVQQRLNAMAEKVAGARSELRAVEGSKPDPRSFPTPKEMMAWTERVNAARLTAADWDGKWKAADQQRATVEERLKKAQHEFNRLNSDYTRVEQQIAAGGAADTLRRPDPEQFFARPDQPDPRSLAILSERWRSR